MDKLVRAAAPQSRERERAKEQPIIGSPAQKASSSGAWPRTAAVSARPRRRGHRVNRRCFMKRQGNPATVARVSQQAARNRQGLWLAPPSFKQPVAVRPTTPPYLHPKKRYLKFKPNNGQCKLCPWHMRFLHYGGSAAAVPPIADIGTQPRNVCFVPQADNDSFSAGALLIQNLMRW